eukprot:GEMP01014010.1.p1 GENE.GEMP01014010.1~~GEMP01014010.1.p1  ORF type:complete len:490 (+),score=91.14 GEMP01014010.1:397-1866(+)
MVYEDSVSIMLISPTNQELPDKKDDPVVLDVTISEEEESETREDSIKDCAVSEPRSKMSSRMLHKSRGVGQQRDFLLLEGVACPIAKFADSRKLAAIFCNPDGETNDVGLRTPHEILSLFPRASKGLLWRDLRPLLDVSELDFKLFIRSSNGEQQVHNRRVLRSPECGGGIRWIAIRTDFVSALIEPNRVLFILNHGENATFPIFLSEFRRLLPATGRFDHFTLDALLAASLKIHKMRFQVLKPVVVGIISDAASSTSEDSVTQLFPVRRCLNQFKERLRPVHAVLQLFVWEKDDPNVDFEDITDLLHPWLDGVEELVADVHEVVNELEDTVKFMDASMNSTRNRYLVLELFVGIITLSLTFGSLVSGIFGMNLTSGLEDDGHSFYVALACMAVTCCAINFAGYWYFVRSRPSQRFGKLIKFGDTKFFQNFSNDKFLLNLHLDTDVPAASRSGLHLMASPPRKSFSSTPQVDYTAHLRATSFVRRIGDQ